MLGSKPMRAWSNMVKTILTRVHDPEGVKTYQNLANLVGSKNGLCLIVSFPAVLYIRCQMARIARGGRNFEYLPGEEIPLGSRELVDSAWCVVSEPFCLFVCCCCCCGGACMFCCFLAEHKQQTVLGSG